MRTRDETPLDVATTRAVVSAAFEGTGEADLVDALRSSGDCVISLVAESRASAGAASQIVGHVMFSRLRAPLRCLALAPVSVLPDWQGRGIGSALIREGLARAQRDGWDAVFVLGEPAYYERFGFRAVLAEKFESPFAGPYFMALELAAGALEKHDSDVVYAGPFQDLT